MDKEIIGRIALHLRERSRWPIEKKEERSEVPSQTATGTERRTEAQRKIETQAASKPCFIECTGNREKRTDELRQNPQPNQDTALEEVDKSVHRIRRTAAGDLIFILDKISCEKTAQLHSKIERALGQEATVQSRTQEINIEIRDIDEAATKEEMSEAFTEQFCTNDKITLASIRSIRKAFRDTQTTVVRLAGNIAKKTIDARKVTIRWVVCRVREQATPIKCYKCWQYDHTRRNCKSDTDRSGSCVKCGVTGHKMKVCEGEAHCVLCKENSNNGSGLVAGSSGCPVFTLAL